MGTSVLIFVLGYFLCVCSQQGSIVSKGANISLGKGEIGTKILNATVVCGSLKFSRSRQNLIP